MKIPFIGTRNIKANKMTMPNKNKDQQIRGFYNILVEKEVERLKMDIATILAD